MSTLFCDDKFILTSEMSLSRRRLFNCFRREVSATPNVDSHYSSVHTGQSVVRLLVALLTAASRRCFAVGRTLPKWAELWAGY